MFNSKKKTIDENKLFGLNLISNCNNEATFLEVTKEKPFLRRKKRFKEYYVRESKPYVLIKDTKKEKDKPYEKYKIPSPPVPKCSRFSKCKKLICSPLSAIGIQLQEDMPKKLGEGSFNLAYTVKNHYSEESKDLVFRVTKPRLGKKYPGQILQEQIGLEYQTLLSKPINENGFGCPYISKVYDFGIFEVVAPTPFVALTRYARGEVGVYSIMEKVNGGELYERILTHNYTLEESKRLMINLLECLNCMHKNKIVHLDLKPENIVLVYDELSDNVNKNTDIKVIDFGLSGEIEDNIDLRGTPSYVSLGMVSDVLDGNKHKITFMDDIWSAGIILLDILTGNPRGRENYDKIHKLNRNTFFGLKPNNKTYEIIREKYDLSQEEWAKLQTFLEKIFGKVGIKRRIGSDGKTLIPTTEQPTITAEQLLKDAWLKSSENDIPKRLGGKKKTLRKKKEKKHTKKNLKKFKKIK